MSDTEQSLLQDVIDHPDDDGPRLVYADWLEKSGSPRGEFIRVQCELARIDPHDPRRTDLESRELQLVRQFSKGWAGEIREFATKWWFRRGFVWGVKIDAQRFLEHADALMKLAPIQHVQFSMPCALLEDLVDCASLEKLQSISLQDGLIGSGGNAWQNVNWQAIEGATWEDRNVNYQAAIGANAANLASNRADSGDRLRAFLASPHLANIKCLMLEGNNLGDDGLQAISRCNELTNLSTLDLRLNDASAKGLEQIFDSAMFQKVEHLFLDSCLNNKPHYDEDQTGPLPRAIAPIVEQLTTLDLTRCCLTLRGLRTLGDAKLSKTPKHLKLEGNQFYEMNWLEDENVYFKDVHSNSPLFNDLVSLDVSTTYLENGEISTIATDSRFQSVCRFAANNMSLKEDDVQSIAQSEYVTNLTHICLNGANRSRYNLKQIGDKGFRVLMESPQLKKLASLSVRRSGLKDISVTALLESALIEQLYDIDLSHNEIKSREAKMLAAHGPWPKLARLNLRGNKLSKLAKRKLRESFGYRVIF